MPPGGVTATGNRKIFTFTLKKAYITSFTHYNDQELLALIQQGNEQALTALYYRYYAALCLKAYKRITSAPLVEEIVQDVFVNLWLKSASLDTGGNVRAYLYATLRNKILHELRSARVRSFYLARIEAPARDATAPGDGLQRIYARETEERISRTILSLPPQCRQAFLLSRYEGLSYMEIAERMHVSVNTVEKHVGKALRVLRKTLEEHEGHISIVLLLLLFSH